MLKIINPSQVPPLTMDWRPETTKKLEVYLKI
jgi:hypothetical protein